MRQLAWQVMLRSTGISPPTAMEIQAWASKMSYSREPLNAGFLLAVDGRGAKVLAVCLICLLSSLPRSEVEGADSCSVAGSART